MSGAKKILDESINENIQYHNFFAKSIDESGEGGMFAQREIYVSEDLIKRIVNTVQAKGKADWAAEYKRKTASFVKY